jgi:excisionase family DNA binding protein
MANTPKDPIDPLLKATQLAKVLNVDPATVYNWAKAGSIPVAFRVGESVRFRLDEVLAAGSVDSSGEGRSVQLTVLALTIVFGERFPRTPLLDLGSITFDEMEQIKKLCTAYQADLESMETPEECAHYCEGVLAAARLLARGITHEPPDHEAKV